LVMRWDRTILLLAISVMEAERDVCPLLGKVDRLTRYQLRFRFACATRQGIGLAAFKNGFDNARREQRKTQDATEVELVDALGRHVPPAMGARPAIHVSIRRLEPLSRSCHRKAG
jgi:hypothetical protein